MYYLLNPRKVSPADRICISCFWCAYRIRCSTETPQSYRLSTWQLPSPEVRNAFNRVIAQGYEPQILEAYGRFHKLIHPNNVKAHMAGAIVLVYCTLEKIYFDNRRGQGDLSGQGWHFYANLVKVHVLHQPALMRSVLGNKRQRGKGYGPDDSSGSGGLSATRKSLAQNLSRTAISFQL